MKKYIKTMIVLLLVFVIAISLSACEKSNDYTAENTDTEAVDNNGVSTDPIDENPMISEVIYPRDEVVVVNIAINSNDYEALVANAMDEEYYSCDITYNNYTLYNVAIRTKGNSSLKDVYQEGDDRFSYNIDLNYYEDQDLFGIDKIILNNLFGDPSMMAEYMAYEALQSLDAISSRTTFTALYINDEYYGLYLSVEQIGNEFLDTNFGNSDNELYKPEIGIGANLEYISDADTYTSLDDKNADEDNNDAVIELMKNIESGSVLDEVFDVDNYLKYLAVSTFTANLDSYQGGMFHNYYLYNNNGVFEWIAWDLNMAFNGFPMSGLSDSGAISFLIDEPVANSMSSYPLIEAIFSNDIFVQQYHLYLEELMNGFFNNDTFLENVTSTYNLISPYVQTDSNSFYTYSEFEDALFTSDSINYSILQFVEERNINVSAQLSGEIPSTNNGDGNVTSSGFPNLPPRR